jgi:hypothetical protein
MVLSLSFRRSNILGIGAILAGVLAMCAAIIFGPLATGIRLRLIPTGEAPSYNATAFICD